MVWYITLKAQRTKENNNNKPDITKIKHFCSMKETNKKTKATLWEKNICKSQVWHKTYIQKYLYVFLEKLSKPSQHARKACYSIEAPILTLFVNLAGAMELHQQVHLLIFCLYSITQTTTLMHNLSTSGCQYLHFFIWGFFWPLKALTPAVQSRSTRGLTSLDSSPPSDGS